MVQSTRALRSTVTQAQSSNGSGRSQRPRLLAHPRQVPIPAPVVQASGTIQRWRALADASPRVAQLQRLRALVAGDAHQKVASPTPSTGLPEALQRGIEALSGLAMDHVRVHHNSPKPAQFNAHAFAQGSDIHLAPGQDRHLPHEAWHLVQQAQGRVRPTLAINGGVAINDDPALEREADQMGARASRIGGS